MNNYLCSLIFLLTLPGLNAQEIRKKIEDHSMSWYGYYSDVKTSSRFSVVNDIQARTIDRIDQWSQLLARTGLAFHANEKFTLTVGFADFLSFQKNNTASKSEYRPWQEIAIKEQYGRITLVSHLRFEQRWFQDIVDDHLIDKYNFNYRLRYRFDFQYPVYQQKLTLLAGNETMLNAGSAITYNYFDQNRTWVGLAYTINENFTLQLQAMKIFQQMSNGSTLDKINVLRFNLYHTINLKKNGNNSNK